MQQVHRGITRQGVNGLFTGNVLVWSFNGSYRNMYYWPRAKLAAWVARQGWELV